MNDGVGPKTVPLEKTAWVRICAFFILIPIQREEKSLTLGLCKTLEECPVRDKRLITICDYYDVFLNSLPGMKL